MSLLTRLFHFIMLATQKHNIDESHGISHSMNVLFYANQIYQSELFKFPHLETQERIIYVSAALHDMADKKYVAENQGIQEIVEFLNESKDEAFTPIAPAEIDVITTIIQTMSYSKVKKQGFPDLGEYQSAYHIVREADLLTAYDFDRCLIYNMKQKNGNILEAIDEAEDLFTKRMFLHNSHGLFLTDYSKQKSLELHSDAVYRIKFWQQMAGLRYKK
jgi:HD superfamily phosphodiesterase